MDNWKIYFNIFSHLTVCLSFLLIKWMLVCTKKKISYLCDVIQTTAKKWSELSHYPNNSLELMLENQGTLNST